MTKQIINLGQTANDRTGDPLRTAFQKVNENFDELYALASADIQIPAQTNNGGKFLTTNGTTLSWSSISQEVGTANTGFVDDRIYNLNGPVLSNDDLVHGPTARLSLPEYGDTVNPISLYNNYGNFSVLLGPSGAITSSWTFESNGKLTLPSTGTIENTESTQSGSGVIYTFATDYNGNTNGLSSATSIRLTGGTPANAIQEGYVITFANGTTKTVTTSIVALPDNWDLFWSGDLTIANGADVWPITVQSTDYTPGTITSNLLLTPDGSVTWTLQSTGILQLPVNGDIVDSTGTSVLSNGTNTGNITFTNSEIASTTGYFKLTGGEGSSINIPQQGSNNPIWMVVDNKEWYFNTDGSLNTPNYTLENYPAGGTYIAPTSSTVIYTQVNSFKTGFKLLINADQINGVGQGFESQIAEALVAGRRFSATEPVITVYGVTYTSATPILSFTVRRGVSNIIEVVAENLTADDVRVTVKATEISGQ